MTGEEPARDGGTAAEVPGGETPADEVPGGTEPAREEPARHDSAAGEVPAPREDADAEDRPRGGLEERDLQILALEGLQWKYQGAKEMEIRRRLGLSPTLYYQRLNVLIDTRAALEHAPMLVSRLRRQRGDAP